MAAFSIARRRTLCVLGAGPAALVTACSPLRLINGLVPEASYRRREGLAYGAHPRQRLDVYRPVGETADAPMVVFFYGGNWNSGERGDYLFVGEALAAQGFVTVIPDYRLDPEVAFPAFLADCAAAVRWSVDNAAAHGGDGARIILAGHSAGAYNAAMLALDGRYLRAAGVEARRVRALVGLAGPYDFLPLQGAVTRRVFGFPDTPITTQPIHFVHRGAPPAFLAIADRDDVVDPGNSARLAAALRMVGVEARTAVYPGLSHRLLIGALASPLRSIAPVLQDAVSFMREMA